MGTKHKEKNVNNFFQQGETTTCGHCDKRFEDGLKQAEKMGFTKCDCRCHKKENIEPNLSIEGVLIDFKADKLSLKEAREEILETMNGKIMEKLEPYVGHSMAVDYYGNSIVDSRELLLENIISKVNEIIDVINYIKI